MANDNPSRAGIPGALSILGFSARAATFSALRAGFAPTVCDHYGDADLVAVAKWVPLPEAPGGVDARSAFPSALKRMPDAPWLYCGGLEAVPELVRLMERIRPLWGNGGANLEAVGNPFQVATVLQREGFQMPDLRMDPPPMCSSAQWLRKRRRASGGRHVVPASASAAPAFEPERHYFQRRLNGRPISALYVASRDESLFLGATLQLVGEPWLHAPQFSWCGNVGPLRLATPVTETVHQIGKCIAKTFSLRGLFGIDYLMQDEGLERPRVVPIDVNPRYTGAVEIVEHALGLQAIALHQQACESSSLKNARIPVASTGGIVGKAVLFAPRGMMVREDLLQRYPADPFAFPEVADVPTPGTRIKGGQPVMTVFARETSYAACLRSLRRGAQRIYARLDADENPAC